MRSFLVWLLLTVPALAQTGMVEDSTPLPVTIDKHVYALESFIARPAAGTRFPVVLLLHGAAMSDGEVASINLAPQRQWARTMASRGWLAVSIARRGYAGSEGEPFLKSGTCEEPALASYLDHQADDGAAVLDAIAQRPDADMSRVLLIGKSVGGAVALDLASRSGVKVSAVVNVAGGVSSQTGPLALNRACGLYFSDLVWNFARFGATSRMPTAWLYAENDTWFSPELVGRMEAAYHAAGGLVDLTMLPAFSPDGHDLFELYRGQYQLLPLMDGFLRQNGLPTWNTALLQTLTAAVKPAQRWLVLDYLQMAPAQKALAIADGEPDAVAWGSDPESVDKAQTYALQRCTKAARRPCHVAAVNYDPVPAADQAP